MTGPSQQPAAYGYDNSPKTTLYTHDRLHEVIQRLEYLVANKQLHNKPVVASLMGIIDPPGLSLLDVVDTYQSIDETRLKDHSPNQLRKWRIQRDTCVRIFINVIGHNVPLNQLTRKHAAALHDYWKQLILRKEVQSNTANKSISMLRTMLVKSTTAKNSSSLNSSTISTLHPNSTTSSARPSSSMARSSSYSASRPQCSICVGEESNIAGAPPTSFQFPQVGHAWLPITRLRMVFSNW